MVCHILIVAAALLVAAAPAVASSKGPDGAHNPQQAIEDFLGRVGLQTARRAGADLLPVTLVSARQDWKHLTADRSCHTLTSIRIGQRTYRKGLGAHSNGIALFRLNRSYVRFAADVGIDNNPDTGGVRGSVQFIVKVDGREAARTATCRGGEAPRPLNVPLGSAKQIELIVTDAGDGIAYDQADWADARVIDGEGHAVYLSDVLRESTQSRFLEQQRLPASFVYGGITSDMLLPTWTREERQPVEHDGRIVHEVVWREPGGGLAATWRADVLSGTPSVEFRWTFTNEGRMPARALTRVLALDLEAAASPGEARLIHSSGGLTGGLQADDLGFAVDETPLGQATLAGAGGRSSNRDLPLFVVHGGDDAGGIFVGIGWSGHWQADLHQDAATGKLEITAGMPGMDLVLNPGENITTPSILLGTYEGEASNGCNALRRLLYTHYVPLLGGRKPLPPVSWNSWFVLGNTIAEDLLKREADVAAELGIEYFCIDAGWFDGDFPDGVGNWTVQQRKFARGLGPIGEHVRSKGMNLGLWFEPERVAANTRLAREHPEWVHGDLLDLGIPAAREWALQMMRGYIDQGGVRWIRFDFNTDPLPTWDRMDTPGARGRSQIRHIEGLYWLLDQLRAQYPDLLIEGCASGGRRIDLETIRRSHTFWKSDETASLPVMRFHESGGNMFLPAGLLNASLLEIHSPYDVASLFGGPLGLGADLTKLSPSQKQMMTRLIGIYKSLRPRLNGWFYPLFPQQRTEAGWIGWQFHDPETGEGAVIVLRPAESRYRAADLRLHGLTARASYVLMRPLVVPNRAQKMSGSRLMEGLAVSLGQPGSAEVLLYRPASGSRDASPGATTERENR